MKNAPQTFGANKLIHVSLTWLGMIVYLDYTAVYVLQHQFVLAILVKNLVPTREKRLEYLQYRSSPLV